MQGSDSITKSGFMTNPAIKRLKKIVADEQSSTTATYTGVAAKTVFFLILTFCGVAAYYILAQIFANSGSEMIKAASNNGVFEIEITVRGAIVLAGASVVTLVTAFLSVFITSIVPVTGTLYVLGEGYLLAFVTDALAEEFKWMGFTALLLTILIVLTMLLLYSNNKIKVGHKFKAVISTVFIVLIVGSLLSFIFSLIPGLNKISQMMQYVMANPVISLAMSAFFVLLACMFLVSDFDNVRAMVDNRMPKKYEWACAFGIAYTVLYLYLKILQLLIEIFGKKSD